MSSIWMHEDVEPHDDIVEIHAGVIANTVTAVTDKCYVIISDLDPGIRVGPCYWVPNGGQFPTKGNSCVVVFDNRNRPWIMQWGPVNYPGLKEITSVDASLVVGTPFGPIVDLSVVPHIFCTGVVSPIGSILQGTTGKYTVTHPSTGNYTITLANSVGGAQIYVQPQSQSVVGGAAQSSGTVFSVYMTTPGAWIDCQFSFAIIGVV